MNKLTKHTVRGSLGPLAVKNGIAPSRVWLPEGHWSSIGQFLVERFEHVAQADLMLRLERGDIVDGAGQHMQFKTPYQPKQWLWYYRQVENEVPVPFEMTVLYADEALIAVDKPHFLASTPGGQYLQHTALTRVRQYFNDVEGAISPLHRLDRETAGIMLFGRLPALRGAYQTLFEHHQIDKLYEAIAPTNTNPNLSFPLTYKSRLMQPSDQLYIQEIEGEPNSHTKISVLQSWYETQHGYGALSCYQLQPITGRKHQLRVHLNALGTPILHDRYYPERPPRFTPDDYCKPLQLLARSIGFTDPITQQYRQFNSQQRLARLP